MKNTTTDDKSLFEQGLRRSTINIDSIKQFLTDFREVLVEKIAVNPQDDILAMSDGYHPTGYRSKSYLLDGYINISSGTIKNDRTNPVIFINLNAFERSDGTTTEYAYLTRGEGIDTEKAFDNLLGNIEDLLK